MSPARNISAARGSANVMVLVGLLVAILLLFGCSSDAADGEAPPATNPTPSAAADPKPEATRSAPVSEASDAVPSLEQLSEMGLTDEQADCFVSTIDPDGNGRVEDAQSFLDAMSECDL